jgi:hypothetical protein
MGLTTGIVNWGFVVAHLGMSLGKGPRWWLKWWLICFGEIGLDFGAKGKSGSFVCGDKKF